MTALSVTSGSEVMVCGLTMNVVGAVAEPAVMFSTARKICLRRRDGIAYA